ncbi:MAG: hypothetical protein ACT4PE_03350 [Candidatus Eiseniibacteriota bacterium]
MIARPGTLLVAVALAAAWFAPVRCPASGELDERIQDSKYPHGDYAFYFGWHDPWDPQFDQHSRFAWPFGGKVRLRLSCLLRVEGDMSYYQRGGEVVSFITAYSAPGFDGLVFAVSLQAAPFRASRLRPYFGAGPVGVSLGNDFAAEILGVDADIIDKFVLASWSELDLGWQGVVGLDIAMGGRASPFVEYRHFLGELEVEDINVGFLTVAAEDLAYLDGTAVSRKYDWSGPNLLAGLRIRF